MLDYCHKKSEIRVLWANHPGESLDGNMVSFFPDADSNAQSLSPSEVGFLMTGLSPVYDEVLDTFSHLAASETGLDKASYQVILREPVVLITYLLLDRMLRLNKVLGQTGRLGLNVATRNGVSLPKTTSHLIGLVDGSQEFNQYLISSLASKIWQLPSLILERSQPQDVRNPTPTRNLNFDHPSFLVRINRKIFRTFSSCFGKIPALRLANVEAALLDKGLYGVDKLMWLHPLPFDNTHDRNFSLRQKLRRQLSKALGSVLCEEFFSQHFGLGKREAQKALGVFSELLLELTPPDRLEGMPRYLKCEQHLKTLGAPALVFCGMPSGEDIHWIAAARKLRIPVIGVQHGVHYGFTNHACFIETELAYCDCFVTWGWDQFPTHPLSRDTKAIVLPSPWLSERANKWKSVPSLRKGGRSSRPHDVLLMSDRIQSFPPSIYTLRMSRLDFLSQLNSSTSGIVSELAHRRIRVLHKPYNYTSRDIQAKVHDRLAIDFPDYYSEYKELDKGLSLRLMQSAWLVLWDEPGTGFFECLLGGIPSMV